MLLSHTWFAPRNPPEGMLYSFFWSQTAILASDMLMLSRKFLVMAMLSCTLVVQQDVSSCYLCDGLSAPVGAHRCNQLPPSWYVMGNSIPMQASLECSHALVFKCSPDVPSNCMLLCSRSIPTYEDSIVRAGSVHANSVTHACDRSACVLCAAKAAPSNLLQAISHNTCFAAYPSHNLQEY